MVTTVGYFFVRGEVYVDCLCFGRAGLSGALSFQDPCSASHFLQMIQGFAVVRLCSAVGFLSSRDAFRLGSSGVWGGFRVQRRQAGKAGTPAPVRPRPRPES